MPDLLVLCYHAVSPDWPADLAVTPAALDAQLAHLVARGYRGARLTDALAEPRDGPTVVVTFDDGFRSVLEEGKPILDRHGLVGTVFVPSDWPGEPGPMHWPGIDRWLGTRFAPELRSLSWGQLRDLAADGWEIGSHTCSHPRLPQLGDEALHRELRHSKAMLEAVLGRACTSLAYPYGDVDERVERATIEAGYVAAVGIPRLLHEPRPLRWPRTAVFHGDSGTRFRMKVSPELRRMRRTRLGEAVDRARVARSGGP